MGGKFAEDAQSMDGGRTLAKENMEDLRNMLEDYYFLDYSDWEMIVSVWFVDPKKRDKTLDLLKWGKAGRIGFEENTDIDLPEYVHKVPSEESVIGPDFPPYAVPGLPEHLKEMTLKQIGNDMDDLRAQQQILDVQGYRGSTRRRETISIFDLSPDVFIRSLKPGKAFTVTGNPGDGKTHFGMNFIAAPALQAGWAVVSNITVRGEVPEHYYRVRSFAESISTAIECRERGQKVILLRDEAALNRKKSDATKKDSTIQKVGSLVFARKLGIVEGLITQLPRDIPSELLLIRTHFFHKPPGRGQRFVLAMTPSFSGLVTDLPAASGLKRERRPYLDFDTDDVSPYDVAADVVTMAEYEFSKPVPQAIGEDGATNWHFDNLKKTLEGLLRQGFLVQDPVPMPQLKRLILDGHIADPRVSEVYYLRFFGKDLAAQGIKDRRALKEMFRSWGIWSHPIQVGKACEYCLENHPTIGADALRRAVQELDRDEEAQIQAGIGGE